MHQAVLHYVGRFATDQPIRILDIGSRDVNGTPRHLFPNAHYLGADLLPGPGVDLVADMTHFQSGLSSFDLVLCLEVLEHCASWRQLIANAWSLCKLGGRIVVTCAARGRAQHSGIDGGPRLHPGEHYAGIRFEDLHQELQLTGFFQVAVAALSDAEDPAGRFVDLQATALAGNVRNVPGQPMEVRCEP